MRKIKVYPMSLGPSRAFGPPEVLSAPYPLGCLVSYAKVHAGGVLTDHFDFQNIKPVVARDIPDVLQRIDLQTPTIILLSSYVWNHDVNLEFAREVKRRCPEALIVIGGPHIPRLSSECERFLREHACIDIAARNEGEVTSAEILEAVVRIGSG